MRRYVYDHFKEATGISVVDVVADLAEPQVKAMDAAGRVDWDVAFVEENYPAMHEAGMFVPIDYSFWDQESLEGVPQHARLKDAVTMAGAAQLLAYAAARLCSCSLMMSVRFRKVARKAEWISGTSSPFLGARGLYATLGVYSIQFALLADGLAHKDIWPLTDDKLDRAFAKLNEIKPSTTKWWTAAGEPPQLLINREYAATTSWDNRVTSAICRGAPLKIVWDGATMGYSWVNILKGPNTVDAQRLVAFLNRAQIAAGFTQGTGLPGPNTNQLKYLPADLIPLLSINPENTSKVIKKDIAWFAAKRPDGKTNKEHVQEHWVAWRVA